MYVCKRVYRWTRWQDVRAWAALDWRPIGKAGSWLSTQTTKVAVAAAATAVIAVVAIYDCLLFFIWSRLIQNETEKIDSFGCQQAVLGLTGLASHIHHIVLRVDNSLKHYTL